MTSNNSSAASQQAQIQNGSSVNNLPRHCGMCGSTNHPTIACTAALNQAQQNNQQSLSCTCNKAWGGSRPPPPCPLHPPTNQLAGQLASQLSQNNYQQQMGIIQAAGILPYAWLIQWYENWLESRADQDFELEHYLIFNRKYKEGNK